MKRRDVLRSALALAAAACEALPKATPSEEPPSTARPQLIVPTPLPSVAPTPLPTARARTAPPLVGVTAYDWFAQKAWRDQRAPWGTVDPLAVLGANGVEWLRAGVTTRSYPELENLPSPPPFSFLDGHWCSMEYTLHVLEAGARVGMALSLFFFLSDRAAGGSDQSTPRGWEGYSLDETADALEQHTKKVAAYYQSRGLTISRYEIGNEIDFGVAGFSISDRIPSTGIDVVHDVAWVRDNVWRKEAVLLKAAIRGVKAVNPTARILLHLAGIEWPWLERAFISTMVQLSVPFDEVGFSYAPWLDFHQDIPHPADYFEQSMKAAQDLGKQINITEISFPSSEPAGLPVVPVHGYPFTPVGQAEWVRDFLRRVATNRAITTVFYFYPDNFLVSGIGPAALFERDGTPKPALLELGR